MDGWTVEHWIESNDAISPEDGRYWSKQSWKAFCYTFEEFVTKDVES